MKFQGPNRVKFVAEGPLALGGPNMDPKTHNFVVEEVSLSDSI